MSQEQPDSVRVLRTQSAQHTANSSVFAPDAGIRPPAPTQLHESSVPSRHPARRSATGHRAWASAGGHVLFVARATPYKVLAVRFGEIGGMMEETSGSGTTIGIVVGIAVAVRALCERIEDIAVLAIHAA